MKINLNKRLKKLLKISFLTILSLIILMAVLPFFFRNTISEKIQNLANEKLNGELKFSGINLSFFNHFPNLTLTLHDFLLKGSPPFQMDTLISADEIAFGINLKSLISETIEINKIFLDKAFINIQVSSNGEANYNVYQGDTNSVQPESSVSDSTSTSTALNIELIKISKTHLVYNDRSLPMLINAHGFSYNGRGDLSKSLFDLYTKAHIDSLDFYYDGTPYVLSKEINADLITKINTSSLAFIFEKNNLKINKLPVKFTGFFEFLENGYKMDFSISSENTGLKELFTALPPSYLGWLEKTRIKGQANMSASLKGNYIAETEEMPDLAFELNISDGFIRHEKAPYPVKNLLVNFVTSLPGLNPDRLIVNIDSLFFNIEKDYFRAVIKTEGIANPEIYAKIDTEIDLENWDKAYGINDFDFKGHYSLHMLADGEFFQGPKQGSLRKDTVLLSIPKFKVQSSLKKGYFKHSAVSEAIKNIGFDLEISCRDSLYRHINLNLKDLNAEFLNNYIKGYLHTSGFDEVFVDAGIESKFDFADVQKVYPLDSISLNGFLSLDLKSKGKYSESKKLFPVTHTDILLKNGLIKTPYYPEPIKDIQLVGSVIVPSDQMKDVRIEVKPFSFIFEGQTFVFNANLQNLDDLLYNVSAKGKIDIGKIYKVFSQKGMEINGFIDLNLSLKGKQSDATKRQYQKLNNQGTLIFRDIALNSEFYPKPFVLRNGKMRFDNDKIWLEKFTADYGKSQFVLNGYVGNIFDYLFLDKGILKGNFDLSSDYILVDELMVFSSDATTADSTQNAGLSGEPSGVIIIPDNLEIAFTANAKSIMFQEMRIRNFKGKVEIRKGLVLMKETGFEMAGAKVSMDATYGSIDPMNAFFDYQVKANDFDIHRAYEEITMFREMASSAKSAKGIVSLEYNLKGKLDGNMMPVFPTIEGGGVLTLKKVKVAGLKMFTEISRKTQKESLKNPDLSTVEIKTRIKNNVITIEPLKFKIAGFRPRISGETTFDGKLNLKFRLGLPPLGIFGIPMNITGTQTNPKIRFGKGGNSEIEEDSSYSDELPAELLKRIKESKEEDIEEAPDSGVEIK